MNEIDYIILTILLISVVIGLLRGCFKEILKLINLAVASYGALYFRNYVSEILHINQSELVPKIICSILVWICLFIAGSCIVYLICKLANIQGIMKVIDKLLGTGYGFLRCFAICLLVVYLVEKNSVLVNYEVWKKSVLVSKIKPISASLEQYIPDAWKSTLNEMSNINFNNSNNSSNNG